MRKSYFEGISCGIKPSVRNKYFKSILGIFIITLLSPGFLIKAASVNSDFLKFHPGTSLDESEVLSESKLHEKSIFIEGQGIFAFLDMYGSNNLLEESFSYNSTFSLTKLSVSSATLLCTDSQNFGPDCDFDGDGIINSVDLDDDNDGILDIDESLGGAESGFCSYIYPDDFDFTSCGGSPDIVTSAGRHGGGGISGLTGSVAVGFHDTELWKTTYVTNIGGEYTLGFKTRLYAIDPIYWGGVSSTSPGFIDVYLSSDGCTLDQHIGTTPNITSTSWVDINLNFTATIDAGFLVFVGGDYWAGNGVITFNSYFLVDALSVETNNLGCPEYGFLTKDIDGDGIFDHFDLDSDGDGCPDSVEAGIDTTNLVAADVTNGNGTDDTDNEIINMANAVFPSTNVGDNGFENTIETVAESGIYDGVYTYSEVLDDTINNCPVDCASINNYGEHCDFDGDGIINSVDLDDDNDGILDINECQEILIEENFGTGIRTTSPFTDYQYISAGYILDGQYAVDFNPHNGRSDWHDAEDHTQGDVSGRMLLINADFVAGEFYRNDGITVTANADYRFESFFAALVKLNPAICGGDGGIPINLKFLIEDSATGNELISGVTGDYFGTNSLEWNSFQLDFNTGAITSINLVLLNNGNGGCGNDVAIDDIRFITLSPCDTDEDGILDSFDTDSDNDDCNDVTEAGHTDPDLDGVLGTSPVVVDVFGVVQSQGGYTNTLMGVTQATQVTLIPSLSGQTAQTGAMADFTVSATALKVGSYSGGLPNYTINATEGLRYQWQVDDGGGFVDIVSDGLYVGANSSTLSISNVQIAMDSNNYRVMVNHIGNKCAQDESFQLSVIDACDPDASGNTDTDKDGISDVCDIDDDNDGILDVDESTVSCSDLLLNGDFTSNASWTFSAEASWANAQAGYFIDTVKNRMTFEATHGGISTAHAALEETGQIVNQLDFNFGFNYAGLDQPTEIHVNGEMVLFIDMVDRVGGTIFTYANGATGTPSAMLPSTWKDWTMLPVHIDFASSINVTSLDIVVKGYAMDVGGTKTDFVISDIKLSNTTGFGNVDANGIYCQTLDVDTDNDNIPNHLDLDSDNDGCPDAIEGSDGFTYDNLESDTSLGDDVATSGANIGVPTITSDGDGQTIGSAIDNTVQATECDACDATSTLFTDNDLDGIGDACDLDDDNDGILDVDECPPAPETWTAINWTTLGADANTVASASGQTFTDIGTTLGIADLVGVDLTLKYTHNGTTSCSWVSQMYLNRTKVTGTLDLNRIDAAFTAYNGLLSVSLSDGRLIRWGDLGTGLQGQESIMIEPANRGAITTSHSGATLVLTDDSLFNSAPLVCWEIMNVGYSTWESSVELTASSITVNGGQGTIGYLVIRNKLRPFCDTDGDTIPDYFDLDSDNDGCPDAIEGAGDIQNSDLELDTSINGTVDTNGIPTLVGTGQTIGGSQDNLVVSVASIDDQLNVLIGADITFTSVATATAVTDFTTDPDTTTSVTTGFLYQWYKSTDDGLSYIEIPGATASTYSIANVSTANNGLYKVAITHADSSCPTEQTAILSVLPCELTSTLSAIATSPTTCSPANDGQITISNGGLFVSTEYIVTYKKDGGTVITVIPNPSTDASGILVLIGLSVGDYTEITVESATDDTCAVTIAGTVSVVEFQNTLSVTISDTEETSFDANDGTITIIPSLGSTPYISSIKLKNTDNELWTSETTSGLVPGVYDVLVADGNGCTFVDSIVIEEVPACTVDVTITSSIPAVLCFGDATITLTANTSIPAGSSATNPLIYVWTDGTGNEIGTSSSVSGLEAGTYKVVVSSTVGGVSCEGAQEIFKITQPSAMLTATISSKDVISVSPGTEGEVNVVASGGTPEYTYAWVDSIGTPIGTTAKITGLTEGTYSVIVTDANGCVTSSLFTSIAAPGCFSINNDSGDVALACNGDTTNLVISLNEDSGNTTITWTSTDADLAGITVDALTLSGVGVGTYKATVVDNVLGCTKTTTLNITENAALSGSIDVGQVGCKGTKTGTLDLSISGGTNSYTYVWSSTDVDLTGYTTSNQDLIGVPAGSYTVLVTDGNNCKITIEDVVVEPDTNINITNVEVVDESCSNCEDGQITVTAAGGTGAYLYSIDAGDIKQEENIFENLLPGVYTVTVYDANGCFVIQENVTIIEDIAPDYKPVIYSGNTQIDKNGNIDFVVLIGELLGNNSDGITPVELRIIKNLNVVYSFDTSITSQGGRVVNNSDWVIDESHSFYVKLIYIGNGGIFIGDTASLIGISAHLIAPNSEGVFPVTATIKFGSGGEVRVDNNVDRELMKFTK